jgi:hypothetical protein
LYRLAHFINANLHAAPDISRLVDWHAEGEVAVRLVRVIAPDIEIDAGGATSHADDSEHFCLFRAQDSGALQSFAG